MTSSASSARTAAATCCAAAWGNLASRWSAHAFVRVHRRYVVNLRRAVEVRPQLNGTAALVMADGSEVPVARRNLPDLLRRLRV